MIRLPVRLFRALRRRRVRDGFTLGPWRRVRASGGMYPQESPRDLAYVRRWSDGSLAGRVWLNGEGIEIRHRYHAPNDAFFRGFRRPDGGNENGVARPWRATGRIALYWPRDEAIRECARQRAVVDAQLELISRMEASWI